MTTILSRHTQDLLNAHQCQGQTNNCGPFSATIVLNAVRKKNFKGMELAEIMNTPRLRGVMPVVRRIPGWATFPWGVADILIQNGLRAGWRVNATLDDLRQALLLGKIPMPIYGEWKPLWAHIATLTAYDEEKGWGFVDSAQPDSKIYWHSRDDFEPKWNAFGNLVVIVDPE